jgi:hypothetical protein
MQNQTIAATNGCNAEGTSEPIKILVARIVTMIASAVGSVPPNRTLAIKIAMQKEPAAERQIIRMPINQETPLDRRFREHLISKGQ